MTEGTRNSYGATPEEWTHFTEVLGLTARVLPVVSNPGSEISGSSKIKGAGKTPSIYNRERKVAGLPKWTQGPAPSAYELKRWSEEPDYGLCIRTGVVGEGPNLVAIDMDSDDPATIATAREFIEDYLGVLPLRWREGSTKCLAAAHVAGKPLFKGVCHLKGGERIELLATGQQFVAAGTHTSGQRYQWERGLPGAIPLLSAEAFDAFWKALNDALGVEPPSSAAERKRGERINMADERLDWLEASIEHYGFGRDGQLFFPCPFKDGHSSDSGETETCYFPAGTGGYERGHYVCLHASCSKRSDAEFDLATGYAESDLIDFPQGDAPASPGRHLLDPKDPLELARGLYRSEFVVDGVPLLVKFNGTWYEHKGPAYGEVPAEEMRKRAWEFLDTCLKPGRNNEGPKRFAPLPANVTATVEALIAVAQTGPLTPPSWLPGHMGPPPCELVSLADGLLHIPTRQLLPHSPYFFNINSLPFSWYDGVCEPLAWLSFLSNVFGDDSEAIEALQEMFGYLLTADTSQQKMFLIVGPKRSGKGTIGRVLLKLLGASNVAGPTLHSLSGQFGLQPLLGKLLALVPDAREPKGFSANQIVERLLMLSGEDTITVDRKHTDAWTGQLTSRVVILTNEIPRFSDASGALASRFITIPTRQSFYGREDPGLQNRLFQELSGIFRWALDGRDRLQARGFFLQPESGKQLSIELQDAASPISAFVEEVCILDPDAMIPHLELFDAWRSWCHKNGHNAGASNSFARKLHAAFPSIRTTKPNMGDGERYKAQVGIRLLQEEGPFPDLE